MKAMTSESTSAYPGIYGAASKITKHKRDVENEEIQAYLSKLKELVPFMPKNRRLSKLEVIQYVIDYICDLQHALETHPSISSAAVHSAAAVMLCSSTQPNSSVQIVSPLHRQPLGVLPPNANVVVSSQNSCSSPESSPVSSSRQSDKVSSTTDSKTVSC
jgi:DNA-binding protein inhibitor ID